MLKWYEINARTCLFRDQVLDLVFPRSCIDCGRLISDFPCRFSCPACRNRYAWISDPACAGCGAPLTGRLVSERVCTACRENPPAFQTCRSLFLHRGIGARLVHTLKYAEGRFLYREIAALLRETEDLWPFLEGKILVPVPLHPRKLNQRGYNQADLVIRAILEVYPHLRTCAVLERTRMTPTQTFLSREARRRNMKNAFVCEESLERQADYLLVDDVLTTGSTLNAAATALRRRGVRRISAFTLAHG